MGERPRRDHALLGEGDGGSLHRADPDRQVPVPLGFLEQDDGLVRGHLDSDADDLHLPHGGSVLASVRHWSFLNLAEGIPLSKYTRPDGGHARPDRRTRPDSSSSASSRSSMPVASSTSRRDIGPAVGWSDSSWSLITRRGRYRSRWAVRMYLSRS